jgi:hypothetical protein
MTLWSDLKAGDVLISDNDYPHDEDGIYLVLEDAKRGQEEHPIWQYAKAQIKFLCLTKGTIHSFMVSDINLIYARYHIFTCKMRAHK